ncbi:Transcription initiation factor TFIID subunit 4 [Balamuthia mandrillaris]
MSSTAPGGGAPDPLGDSLFSVDEMDGDAQQINLLAESLQKETVQSRNVAPPRQPPTSLTPQQTTQQARPPQQQPLATATQQRVGLPPSYTATAHRATTMSPAATNLNPQHTTAAQLSHQRPATTTNFHSTGMPVTSSATSTAPSGVSSYSTATTTNAASAAAAAAARSAALAHRPHVTALPPSSSPAPSVATGVPPGGAPPPLTAHTTQSVTQHYQDVLRHLLSELQAGKITKEQFTHKLSASLGPATAMELIKKFSKPRAPQQSRVVSTQAPPHTTTPSSATHPQHHPQQPPPQTSYKLTQGTTIPQQQPPQQPSHQQGRPPTQAFANVVDEQNKQQPIVRMVKRGTIHPPPSTASSTVNTPTPNVSNPPIITDIKQPPAKKPRTTPTTGSTASTPSQQLTQPPPPPPANNLSSSGGAPTQSAAKAKKTGAESKKADADQPTSLKQLNDVTQFAGVNLKEESLRFMRGEGKDSGMDLVWPEEDPRGPFLQREALRRKVVEIASIHQMKQIHKEVYDHLTCAVEERLRNIIEQLAIISQQRQDTLKDDFKITITSDPRRQLQLIEKREREEQEQRDAEEKEKLKGLKDDSSKKGGDRETQARRHEEEERIRTRHANITALQAIGDIGRPRTRPTASTTTPATTSHLPSSQPQQQNQPPPPSSPSSQQQQSQQPQITFTKEHLRKLQQLQQAKQAGTLTPEMAQEFERLALMFRRMTEQVQRQKASAKAAAAGGSGVVLSHLPASAAAGTTVGGARGRALGPQQQQTGRTINLKDLEFLFLKDPYLKHSKVIHKSFDRKRRKVTVGPSSLSASASSSTS